MSLQSHIAFTNAITAITGTPASNNGALEHDYVRLLPLLITATPAIAPTTIAIMNTSIIITIATIRILNLDIPLIIADGFPSTIPITAADPAYKVPARYYAPLDILLRGAHVCLHNGATAKRRHHKPYNNSTTGTNSDQLIIVLV